MSSSQHDSTPAWECQQGGIVYRVATAADVSSIADLCLAEFYPRMPLFRHLGATTADDVGAIISILPDIIGQGVSLMAEDASTREAIGARLSVVTCRDDGGSSRRHPLLADPSLAARYPKHCLVSRLVNRVESQVDYFHLYGVDRALAFKLLVVKASRGRCGVGRRLVELSMGLAGRLGIQLVVGSAESRHSQRIYDSLGFQRLAAVGYCDYTDPVTGANPFAGLADSTEHKEAVMFAKLV